MFSMLWIVALENATALEKSPFSTMVSLPAPPVIWLFASTCAESMKNLKLPSVSAYPSNVSVSPAPRAVAVTLSVAPDATVASAVVRL